MPRPKENPLRRIGKGEWVTGGILLAVSFLIMYLTKDMTAAVDRIPGPGFMPLVYSRLMIILVILYWLEAGFGKNLRTKRVPKLKELTVPLSFLSVSLVIVLLWEPVGAILAVFAGSFSELMYLQKYNIKKSLFVAAFLALFTWALFEKFLGIPLPPGVLKSILR